MAAASGITSEGRSRWSLHLFGGFELHEIPTGHRVLLGKRERVLLAYLALSPNGRQQRRKLATLLWGDANDETLLDNLRTSLWGLRKALGDSEHQLFASEAEDIAIDTSAFDTDVLAFRRLALQSGRGELEAAADLYSGHFMDGLDIESEDFESWRRIEAARFRDQAVDVLTRLTALLAEAGETERAIETGTRILQFEPLHEAVVRKLMRLYGASGRRAMAVRLYHTLSDALRTELNAQPEAETRAVFAELSRGSEEQPAAADAALAPRPAGMARARDAGPGPIPQSASAENARTRWQARNTGWMVAGGLVAAAMAIFLFRQFAAPTGTTTTQSGIEIARAVSSSPASAIAIAVLPFANLSDDREQEFFSDGITEEISSALAKIPDLRVVGRSSAFQFKGQNQDLRAIGQTLGATHLIEGSVRKEGDRVRITAQLVEANAGVQVWTENYDRQLTGVFAIQEEIATAIAGALKMPLGLQQGQALVANRNIDPESYEEYLRARQMVRSRSPAELSEAAKRLELLLARHPDYAPGWALLSDAYGMQPLNAFARLTGATEEARAIFEASAAKAREVAQRAIELDPNSVQGYMNLAQWHIRRGERLVGMEIRARAEALDPNDPDVLSSRRNNLAQMGYLKQALPISQRLMEVEPFVPAFRNVHSRILFANSRIDEAIANESANPNQTSAEYYAAQGRYREAVEVMESLRPPPELASLRDTALGLLRTAPSVTNSPDALPPLGLVSWVYLHVGAPDRVMDYFEGNASIGYFFGGEIINLWGPPYAPVRKTERFKAYVRAAGMVDYWRAKGWPDLCRPVGADDFVCD